MPSHKRFRYICAEGWQCRCGGLIACSRHQYFCYHFLITPLVPGDCRTLFIRRKSHIRTLTCRELGEKTELASGYNAPIGCSDVASVPTNIDMVPARGGAGWLYSERPSKPSALYHPIGAGHTNFAHRLMEA